MNDPSPPPPHHLKNVLFWRYVATSISRDDIFTYIIFLERAPKMITPPHHKNLTLYKRN